MAAENLLTDAKLRAASPARDGCYLRDGGGLRVRLYPGGAKVAEFHYKLRTPDGFKHGALHLGELGKRFTDAAGKVRPFGIADARAARDAARALVARGVDPREARRLEDARAAEAIRTELAALDARRTLRQSVERWVELYLNAHRKDGGRLVEGLLRVHVLPTLGDRPLDEIRRADIADVLDRIVASGKRRTANACLSALRQFFRWSIARDWVAADPTASLTKAAIGGREVSRDRVLSPAEILELRDRLPAAALPARMVHALWVLLATGVRVGELTNARIEDVDLEAGEWAIPETKSGRPHLVHLSAFAVKHLRALIALAGASAFALPAARRTNDDEDRAVDDKAITRLVRDRQRPTALRGRTVKAAGTLVLSGGPWTPHDLRRTMASRMRALGVPSDVVERCLNHAPDALVGTYQRDDLLDERRDAFDRWGAELERLLASDAAVVVPIARASRSPARKRRAA